MAKSLAVKGGGGLKRAFAAAFLYLCVRRLQLIALALLLLPWLLYFNFGPSPATVSNAVSMVSLCLVLGVMRSWRRLPLTRIMMCSWLCAASISSVMGLLQFFGTAAVFEPWISHAGSGEVFANLRQRNQFATLMCIGVAVAMWMRFPRQWRLVLVGLAILLGAADAASASRTGLLAIVALLALALMWGRFKSDNSRHNAFLYLAATCLGYGLVAVAIPMAWTEFQPASVMARLAPVDGLCSSRLTLWSNVLHLIAQKPWFGWGWGELDYAHFVTLYPGERFCEILDNAHNLPLHLAVELGVPLATLACGLLSWLVCRAKPWAERHPSRQLAWAVLALIGLHSLLEYPLWYGPFQLTVVLCVWMLCATPAQPLPLKPKSGPALAMPAAAATILIVFCAFVAWDYWRISQIYMAPESRHPAYRGDTLAKIQGTWFFKDQVRFAELATTELTPDNAQHLHDLALGLLHFSPEPRVVKKLIESTALLGYDSLAAYYLERFKAAYPQEFRVWKPQPGGSQ